MWSSWDFTPENANIKKIENKFSMLLLDSAFHLGTVPTSRIQIQNAMLSIEPSPPSGKWEWNNFIPIPFCILPIPASQPSNQPEPQSVPHRRAETKCVMVEAFCRSGWWQQKLFRNRTIPAGTNCHRKEQKHRENYANICAKSLDTWLNIFTFVDFPFGLTVPSERQKARACDDDDGGGCRGIWFLSVFAISH